MKSILATTSTFGQDCPDSLNLLTQKGLSIHLNPHGRALKTDELSVLLNEFKPIGILAGTENITSAILEQASPYLKVISRVGTGWDNIDRNTANNFGIKVFRTPDAVTDAVAELTVGLFFDLARKISLMDRQLRQGQWKKQMGTLLQGKTLGIVGCGRIGQAVASRMRGLGVEIVGFDPFETDWFTINKIKRYEDLTTLIANVDLLSLHVPGQKMPLLTADILEHSRPNLLLVNVSRGDVVDETALANALQQRKLAGAALDVFSIEPYRGPLTSLDNVVLTCHVGSYAIETRIRMEAEAIDNLLKGLGDG